MLSSWQGIVLLGASLIVFSSLAGRVESTDTAGVVDTILSKALLFETFDTDDWQSRWKHSSNAKYNGRFISEAAKTWTNKGLKIPEKSKFYGLTALLDAPVDPVVGGGAEAQPLVVQYEVKYSAGITCGGAYLKLLTADPQLAPEGLVDSTPYSIMFGPDRCGGPGKVHLILRHRNPLNGSVEEKHLASPPTPESDEHSHVYTLKIFPDHTFEVQVDGAVKSSGSLLGEGVLQPPMLPPREIPDPSDKKPADWVDASHIPDPDAVKPSDWDDREKIEDESAVKPKGWLDDERELINDPAAKRPEDWDDEEDGEWAPNQIPNPRCKVGCGPWRRPLKPNPAYKGAWEPPMIDNPAYKGPWVQRRIANPDFFEDPEPVRNGVGPIGGVALELWTIDSGYMFDNILITRDPKTAELAVKKLWKPRYDAEVKAFEEQAKAAEAEEKARQKEEEKKKKKKTKKSGRFSSEQLEELAESILNFFEDGAPLAPLAPYLAPLLGYLRESPQGVVLVLGLGPLLLLTLAMMARVLGGGKKTEDAAAEDARTGAAEVEEEEEEEEKDEEDEEGEKEGAAAAAVADDAPKGEQEEGGGAAPAEGAAPSAPAPGEVRQRGEIAAGDEDEEDEQETTGTRRHTRRAA